MVNLPIRFPADLADSGLAGVRMSATEYAGLGDTDERYELIDGVLLITPSFSPPESEIFVEVLGQLSNFARTFRTARVLAETDLEINPLTVYRPDISVYLSARLPKGRLSRLTLAPDLIVEVLSPGTRALDLTTKRDDYGRIGVREYWLIEPHPASVRSFTLAGGVLVESPVAPLAVSLASAALGGFSLDLSSLREVLSG